MLHTFTIQRRIESRLALQLLARHMTHYEKQFREFWEWSGSPEDRDKSELKYKPDIAGYKELKLVNIRCWDKQLKRDVSRYYAYLKMEPLTVITGEKHISLFECTDENIEALIYRFGKDMQDILLLGTSASLSDDLSLQSIVDFTTWDAQRVDYTIDIRMKNHDEVLAFMNLAKMSALSNLVTEAKRTSIYGKNFVEHTYRLGNRTWEMQIYDKESQFRKKESQYEPSHFRSLLQECENLVRIEYRRLTRGTKRASTSMDSRNIMNFLSEEVAKAWLLKCYGETVGFEDFYRAYHMEKLLDKAFPMNNKEIREERKRERAAKNSGDNSYKPEIHSKKFYIYRAHLMLIMEHKGMQNALNSVLAGLKGKARHSAKRKFIERNKNIREKLGISPVLIPDSWKTKRKMDLPNNFLRNPLSDMTS